MVVRSRLVRRFAVATIKEVHHRRRYAGAKPDIRPDKPVTSIAINFTLTRDEANLLPHPRLMKPLFPGASVVQSMVFADRGELIVQYRVGDIPFRGATLETTPDRALVHLRGVLRGLELERTRKTRRRR